MILTTKDIAKMIDLSCVRTTSNKADIEEMVEAARKNMTAQRTRGLPTKIQPFPGLEPPRSRFRIFLAAAVFFPLPPFLVFSGSAPQTAGPAAQAIAKPNVFFKNSRRRLVVMVTHGG